MTGLETALPEDLRQRRAALERGYCSSLESALEKSRSVEPSEPLTIQAPQPIRPILSYAQGLTGAVFQEANLATYAHAELTTQLEAYRRIPILLSRLDSVLSKIARTEISLALHSDGPRIGTRQTY